MEDERLILPIHKPSAGVRLNKIGGLEDASIHSSIFQPSFSCLVYLIQNVNEFVLTEKNVILPFFSMLICLKSSSENRVFLGLCRFLETLCFFYAFGLCGKLNIEKIEKFLKRLQYST